MSTFWEKIKSVLGYEKCSYHNFIILEKKYEGYSLGYFYVLKCQECGHRILLSATELRENISANSPEFLDIEVFSEGKNTKMRNKIN